MQKSRFQIFSFTSCFLIIGFCIFCLVSCQHDSKDSAKDTSPYFINFFTGSDADIFRDVNFNITQDELKKIETSKLYESTADHLFYEFSFPTDSTAFSEYANVQYFFDENNQLDIITSDIYLNDSIQEKNLKNTLTAYYNTRFGKADADENNNDVWKSTFQDKKTSEKYDYSIALKELADDYGVSLEYVRK